MSGFSGATSPGLTKSDVVNNLTSTSTTAPLSANQGKALNDRINSLTIRVLQIQYTVNANSSTNFNLYTRINADLPNGYTCLGIVTVATNNINVYANNAGYYNSDYSLQLNNTSNSSVSTNVRIDYLCYK